MDKVVKGMSDSIQPIPISDKLHNPATTTTTTTTTEKNVANHNIRDVNIDKKNSFGSTHIMEIDKTPFDKRSSTENMQQQELDSSTKSCQSIFKYASPPIGSGGKYMLKSKRASWIDAANKDTSSASSNLPDHLIIKKRKSSMADIGKPSSLLENDGSEEMIMHKSGSITKLREHRLPSIDQSFSSFNNNNNNNNNSNNSNNNIDLLSKATPPSSSTIYNKQRQHSLFIATSSSSDSFSRHRTSSVSSTITDSSFQYDDTFGSPYSSSSYHPSPGLSSPMYINHDKNKSNYLHDHSPGSSSPLSLEISHHHPLSKINNNNKRRSSMNLLKNIPSAELNQIIHRNSLVSEPLPPSTQPPHSPMNDQFSTIPRHTRSYATTSSSISSTKSFMTNITSFSPPPPPSLPTHPTSMMVSDIPTYQHSLHSFLKRQLSAPNNNNMDYQHDIDKDVIEIDLNSEIPAIYPFHQYPQHPTSSSTTSFFNDSLQQQQQQQQVSSLYPALLLDNMDPHHSHHHHDHSILDNLLKKIFYLKNVNVGQISAPEHKYGYEATDYFDIPLDINNIRSPSAQTKTNEHHLYFSRLSKIKNWCLFNIDETKSTVDIYIRQRLDSDDIKKCKKLATIDLIHEEIDLVQCIPWVDWINEYSHKKSTSTATNSFQSYNDKGNFHDSYKNNKLQQQQGMKLHKISTPSSSSSSSILPNTSHHSFLSSSESKLPRKNNLSIDLQYIYPQMESLSMMDESYPQHPLETFTTTTTTTTTATTTTTTTPISRDWRRRLSYSDLNVPSPTTSMDDMSITSSSQRIPSISSSSMMYSSARMSGYPPPPSSTDHVGTIGYFFQDTGNNRMGAFGKLGNIFGSGNNNNNGTSISEEKSSSSSSGRIRHTIKSRLQSTKNACDNELRIIIDGLNEYVERGLRYVDYLEDGVDHDLHSDESDENDENENDDGDDGIYYKQQHDEEKMEDNTNKNNNTTLLNDQQQQLCIHSQAVSILKKPPLHPLATSTSPSSSVSSSSPLNDLSLLHSPSSSHLFLRQQQQHNNKSRLQNIEELAELSSSETDTSQLDTPKDEKFPKTVLSMKSPLYSHYNNNNEPTSSTSSTPPPPPPPTLPSTTPSHNPIKSSSRYTMISEDAYLPTPFILTLQDLICLAQNILDTPLESYLDNAGACASIVSDIQSIGSRWDTHKEWPCREWYVRLLLCVAALNRVVEWWEAERGFWYSNSNNSNHHSYHQYYSNNNPVNSTNNNSSNSNNNVNISSQQQQHHSISSISSSSSAAANLITKFGSPSYLFTSNVHPGDGLLSDHESDYGIRFRSISETESTFSGSVMDYTAITSNNNDDFRKQSGISLHPQDEELEDDYEDDDDEDFYDEDEEQDIKSNSRHIYGSHMDSVQLQEAVKRGQNNAIVMELTLETTIVRYVSPVWSDILQSDPQEIMDTDISDLLVGNEKHIFLKATQDLLQDTTRRTVEIQFGLSSPTGNGNHTLIEMEGKGMLMYNHVTNQVSHTMWVIKPLQQQLHSPIYSDNVLETVINEVSNQDDNNCNNNNNSNRHHYLYHNNLIYQNQNEKDLGHLNTIHFNQDSDNNNQQLHGIYTSSRSRSISEPLIFNEDTLLLFDQDDNNKQNMGDKENMDHSNIHLFVPTTMRRSISHGGVPTSDQPLLSSQALLSLPPVLCRVCERLIVAAFFEQHSELCVELHRTEMDIIICNDNLGELKHFVMEMLYKNEQQLPHSTTMMNTYQEKQQQKPIDDYDDSSTFYFLENILPTDDTMNDPEEQRLMKISICKNLLEIIDDALGIPIPDNYDIDQTSINTMDEDGDGNHHDGSILSTYKDKMIKILYWRPPPTDHNPIYMSFIHDIGAMTKSKVDLVNRMYDRLEYNDRVRSDFQKTMIQEEGWSEFVMPTDNDNNCNNEKKEEENENKNENENEEKEKKDPYHEMNESEQEEEKKNVLSPMIQDSPSSSPKKSIIRRLKTWKDKKTSGMHKLTRRQKRKAKQKQQHMTIHPPIVEMETIDTPLASPGIYPSHKANNNNNNNKQKHKNQQHPPSSSSKNDNQQQQQQGPTSSTCKNTLSSKSSSATVNNNNNPSSLSTTTPTTPTISATSSRPSAPSINDYEIIKPISKGAFGSVFLAKKRLTGDYYAIKFLKKSDMIAKNQVMNVKAERMVLMAQTDSPFVTKLYYTFQSKDYLYLVLEYLNGGDCSALIKVLGRLPEDWARNYLAEVTLGLAYLHKKNIVHRDLKPDNLLIDQNGHLKLTDFGLSRIGFLDRRVRDELTHKPISSDTTLPTSPAPSRSNTPPSSPSFSNHNNKNNNSSIPSPSKLYKHSYFSLLFERDKQRRGSVTSISTTIGSNNDNPTTITTTSGNDNNNVLNMGPSLSTVSTPGWVSNEDQQQQRPWLSTYHHHHHHRPSNAGITPTSTSSLGYSVLPNVFNFERHEQDSTLQQHRLDSKQNAIGTPDYIAPESILGTGQDYMVDWWALGVICYEFLYGYPPFNDDSPDKVFENILSHRIDWHENEIEVSKEARDFMEQLMTLDPDKRLGVDGAEQVKRHPFFKGIDWDNLLTESPSFIPQPSNEEDTAYFDTRGATMQTIDQHQHHHFHQDNEGSNQHHNSLLLNANEMEQVKHAESIIMDQYPPNSNVTSLFEQVVAEEKNKNKSNEMATNDQHDTSVFKKENSNGDGVDFGTFVYKNLPLLEKANEDAIRKIRHDGIAVNVSSTSSTSYSSSSLGERRFSKESSSSLSSSSTSNWLNRSLPAISRKKRSSIFDLGIGSSQSNTSLHHLPFTTSLPTTPKNLSPSNSTKPYSTHSSPPPPLPPLPLLPPPSTQLSIAARNNTNNNIKGKSFVTTTSTTKVIDASGFSKPGSSRSRSISSPGNQHLQFDLSEPSIPFKNKYNDVYCIEDHPPSSSSSPSTIPIKKSSFMHHPLKQQILTTSSTNYLNNNNNKKINPTKKSLDCLLADDNPISCKILETILEKLNCRCVIVRNGAQAIRYAMGNVQFDIIFMDIRMPIIDGEAAARMIKSTKNCNEHTPIIAVTAYERTGQLVDTFDDILSKPVTKEMIRQRLQLYCKKYNDQQDDNLMLSTSSPMIKPIPIPSSS